MTTEPDTPPATAPAGRVGVKRLLPLLVIAAGIALFFGFGLDRYLSFEALSEHRKELLEVTRLHPVGAAAGYVVLYALVAAFSIPGAVWLTLAGGFVFGVVAGSCYTVVGATLGACGIFLAARYALSDFFHERAGPALRRMEAGFRTNAASYLLFLRLVPIFPFWLVNLAPAFFGIGLGTYALWTFLGIIPGTVVYVSLGAGIGDYIDRGEKPDLGIIFEPQYLLPILGLAALALMPVVLKRYSRTARFFAASGGRDAENS